MWERINSGEWARVVPYIAFFLTFGVFLILLIRTLLMRKAHAEHMAHLPLEDQPDEDPTPNRPSQDD